MIRAIIVDDEPNNVDNLKALLKRHCPQVSVAAEAHHADHAIEVIHTFRPDLVFLDILMPGKTGFDLLKSLQRADFEVVFVTGFDQFGIEAIRFSAVDYLLKPIDPLELQSAVSRATAKIQEKQQNLQLQNLVQLLLHEKQKSEHKIALSSSKETRFVKTGEIVRCIAENNYTLFFLESGEKILVSRPMFEYDEMLAAYGFIRPHHSHLVNLSYVKSLLKEDSGYLLMMDDSKIPVSRIKKEMVKKALSRGARD
ncbi:LytTR family DNA-binding domain-containing protein [Ravibacter arvi]|uniref:LytTR family DNA-binding domain-containing protein n=1 Tax=Ravibacter arvi TaxID=2051041 RepID=A0ABP8LW91_9BACT